MDKQYEDGSGNHADSTGNSKMPGRNLRVISGPDRFRNKVSEGA